MNDVNAGIGEFLSSLAGQDIKLWLEDGKLRCNAPAGAMTPELQADLAARKTDLIEFLAAGSVRDDRHQIKHCPRDLPIPLTRGQERIWSLAKIDPASSVYNVPTVFHLSGPLDRAALEQALTALQKRHETLRTVFQGESLADARQEIRAQSVVVLPLVPVGSDLAKLPQQKVSRTLQKLLEAEVRQPFDLRNGPLWRARLFQLGPRENLLAMTMHHIVFDGMSKAIFLAELGAHYAAIRQGLTPALEDLNIQFADVAAWQRQRLDAATAARQLAYWENRLAGGLPPLTVPNDKPRPAGKGHAGSVHFSFPQALTEKLLRFSRQEQASLFIVLMAGFNLLLNRYSGQTDLVVCAPMASREHVDIEKLIGYFNNIVVIRADLGNNPSFRALVAQVKRLAVEAYDNQFVPLQQLAQLPNLVRTPLTRGMLSYQESSSRHLDLPEVKAKTINVRKDAADFDMALYLERDGEKLGGVLDFNADIFGLARIKRLLQRYAQLLDMAVTNPETTVDNFPQFGKKIADIEALLTKNPRIDAAVVVPEPRSGGLNAYLVLNEHDVPSLAEVRAYAQASLPDFRVPLAFIPVDELPLNAEGAVDIAALPPPGTDRSRLPSTYVAPRNALEEALARIWRQVLWLDYEVGIEDRFRDLGGHSLLAVQLVLEIEGQLQRPVPASALATLNTIAELATALEKPEAQETTATAPSGSGARGGLSADIYHGLRSHTASWEGKRTSADSVIVGLNAAGTRQPLFWCLQRYQELSQLAKYLGPDQPVYGMRSGNRVMLKTQENIDRLAAHYVEEILEIQPQGPFLIGGNCQAALIAFQVSSQLTARGHEITLLVLQEKFAPFPYAGPVALLFGDQSDYNPMRHYKSPQLGWRKYYTGPLAMSVVRGGHGQFFREPNVQVLVGAISGYIEQAQAGRFGDASLAAPGASPQLLPAEAYRASLAGDVPASAAAGAALALSVKVTNASPCAWRPWSESGIALANRWLDESGKVPGIIDGLTRLQEALLPGASVSLTLPVKAPAEPGRRILELDLVEEGVTWFGERGSSPLRLAMLISPAS